jgi:PTH1 family peptidyl-tRNA hydrolase
VKLVAGLGNPGEKYSGTRHNVGFEVIDALAARHGVTLRAGRAETLEGRWRVDDGVILAKPLTFMNLSGTAVGELVRFYKIVLDDLLVVCDDVNLPLGRLRLRAEGSEGGHNGLRSIADQLGTTGYTRLRIGVGRGDGNMDLADHVLARFEEDEQPGIERAIGRAADAVEIWRTQGLTAAMNMFNRADVEP